ncbi:HIT family protein [Methylonatrum kenyense]|uniref:HIT family protein n=1 Tax=Methylonatrum kenyense TaxID=455253 RepID=UPI0020BEFFF1|nr:HIT family protein [Methylonatrum kenyense]MCK8515154.1 HIT family protein [Methylonatrum kenyense]
MADYPRKDDCIFCKIVAGNIPAAVIHDDDRIMAFMDAFPSSRGHALVIPKGHYQTILEIPPDLQTACSLMAQRIARAADQVFRPEGISILQFNGEAAGQTVFHYHQHIIPRWQEKNWSVHGKEQADAAELKAQAEQLRAALA